MKDATIKLDWMNMSFLVSEMISTIKFNIKKPMIKVYPIPNGGRYVAGLLSMRDKLIEIVNSPFRADAIVDDVYESGRTAKKFLKYKKPMFFLVDKRNERWKNKWVEFPYEDVEHEREREDLAVRLLQHFGNKRIKAVKFLGKMAKKIKVN